jgi:hypothetical protein
MAYLCIIASVPRDKAGQILLPADVPRLASKIVIASHYMVPAIPDLRDAVDGGTPLETNTFHPLRGFRLQEPAAVGSHAARLAVQAKQMITPDHPLYGDAWTQAEVMKIIDLFHHASAAGEAVVTHLDLSRTGKQKS